MTLAKKDDFNYPALQDTGKTVAIIKDALGGASLDVFTLDRIHVPSGGGTNWEVPDVEEGTRSEKTLSGIIIHSQYYRSYYSEEYGKGEAGPPECFSWVFGGPGVGEPGGDCQTCPLNLFGSSQREGGRGKACQERRFLFMLKQGSFLPTVIQASATSIKSLQGFGLRLVNDKGKGMKEVVVELSLKAEKRGGFNTAIITPKWVADLSEEQCARVAKLAEDMAPMLEQAAQSFSRPEDGDFLE